MKGRVGWVTGLLLLAAVVIFATHLADERELARIAHEAKPLWLLVALLLQAGTYVCAGAVWQRALAHRGAGASLWPLVPLGVAKLFTDQAVPSAGMSGTILVMRGLERRAVSRTDAMFAMLSGLMAFYLAYLIATLGAVAVLWRHGELRLLILVPAALVCLISVVMPVAVLGLRRIAGHPPRWLERSLARWPGVQQLAEALGDVRGRSFLAPRLLAETGALQLAVFGLDSLTLVATLRAVASPVDVPVVFASFVVASVVSTLAWIPGGLGTFEAACVALLRLHGVAIESALAATLLLRGLTFWLPMLPGLALARHELAGRPAAGS